MSKIRKLIANIDMNVTAAHAAYPVNVALLEKYVDGLQSDLEKARADYATLKQCYDGMNDLGNKILAERDSLRASLAAMEGENAKLRRNLLDCPHCGKPLDYDTGETHGK